MKVYIKGGYQTKFGELWDKSLENLIFESVSYALKDANLDIKKVEVIYIANMLSPQIYNQNHINSLVSGIFKVNIPIIRVESACASGGVAINQAYIALKSGLFKNALVIGVEKMTDLANQRISKFLMSAASTEERSSGISFAGLYALIAQKYLSDYKITSKELANISIKNHFHASLNEKSHFPFEINIDNYNNSPIISSPLNLFDCSPISDGACAILLCTDKQKQSVEFASSQVATDSISLAKRENICEFKSTKIASLKSFEESGIERKDIDLLEVHDCFTIAEILSLEDLGFYKKGEGYKSSKNKDSYYYGKLPVNTSGGLKACGHPVSATGVKQVLELFNQIKGRCNKRQVRNARIGLAQNIGGTGGTAVINILKK
ncbi:MAG: thiolase domain-containing protein [Patescibacteria group bacterium]